jgi:hypothetical protein
MSKQLSFLPDNRDQPEPVVKRASAPLVKLIDGKWHWKAIGSDRYELQPELEQTLLAALERRETRKAA